MVTILQSAVVWLIKSIWRIAIWLRSRWECWRLRRMRPDKLTQWRVKELERIRRQAVALAALQTDEDLRDRGRTRTDAVRTYEVLLRSQRGVEVSQCLLDDMDLRCLDLSGVRASALELAHVERAYGDSTTVLPAGLDMPLTWRERAPARVPASAAPEDSGFPSERKVKGRIHPNTAVRCLLDSGEPVVLRRSRWRSALFVALYGVLAFFGGGIGYGALTQDPRAIALGITFAVVGVLSIFGLLRFGRDAISPRDLIWIHDDGLQQRVDFPHVFLPWSEIAEVAAVERTWRKTVAVTVRDPKMLPRSWRVLSKAFGSRLSVRVQATLELLSHLLTFRWTDLVDDVAGIVSPEEALRGSFEINTAAFPVQAQYLATILKERQQAYAARSNASTPPTPAPVGGVG